MYEHGKVGLRPHTSLSIPFLLKIYIPFSLNIHSNHSEDGTCNVCQNRKISTNHMVQIRDLNLYSRHEDNNGDKPLDFKKRRIP
jgi:hypothetical protein